MTNSRLFAEWLFLFAATVALVLVAQQRELTQRLDLWLLDGVLATQQDDHDPGIVIVEIDDRSIETLGTWPWSRDLHARLIDRLTSAGAQLIGLDILFLEPSDTVADDALANALARSGRVILPHSFAADATGRELLPVLPIPELRAASAGTGHVAMEPDSDGSVRRFDLSIDAAEASFPHFARAIATELGQGGTGADNVRRAQAIVPFHAPGTFRTISASEVIDGATLPDLFRDRVVLVGATAQGLGDRYSVPGYAGGMMSGVETQANLLSAIVNDDLVSLAPRAWTVGIQLLAIAMLFFVFWRFSPKVGLVAAVILVGLLILISTATLLIGNRWLAIGPAIFAIIVAYPLWGWRRLASVSRFLDAEITALRGATSSKRFAASGFDHVARQVDRLKNIAEDISSNLRFVQDVIEASPDAMLVLGASGKVDMANQSARDMFGEDVADRSADLRGLIATAGCDFDEDREELVFGDSRCFLLARAPIDHAVGSEVLVFRDITSIREDERQRRETLEFLSHDMRSPQVAIIGLTAKSGERLGEGERLERIENQARRTLKLTDDFVQIARLASEGIRKEDTEVNSVVAEAVDRAFPLANRKRIKLEFKEPDDLLYAEVDASALARALDNLLDNAIKFSPENSRVSLAVDGSDSRHFTVSITDEGPGLPSERVSDPFARFGARSDGAGPSSGLGLAYVKQVVDRHSGTIAVATASGSGTTFRLKLPYS